MPRARTIRRSGVLAAALLAIAGPALIACSNSEEPSTETGTPTSAAVTEPVTLTVYSGRNEELVGPLLDQLKEATGAADVEVRYGDSAEMAAQLLAEGDATDADLFFSQDAGALGALAQAGRLAKLPQQTLDMVPAEYQAADGSWVATSARARVVAYDPGQVSAGDLPQNVDDLVDPKWKGKVGYAPTNASWQAFVTGLRVIRGEDGARDWLTKFADNDPQVFEKNTPILEAVNGGGDIALGLINHYYWFQMAAEVGEDKMNAQLHYVSGNDPAALVNVAGIGAVAGSDAGDVATKAVEFLLSATAQQYFADETAEYPVVAGVTSSVHQLPELDSLNGPDIDLSELASLEETLTLLQEVGLS